MENKTILILGGYGNTGRPLARLLLQESDAQLILAGRNIEKAQQAANDFNQEFNTGRVRGRYADASDRASLGAALDGMDIVVVASATTRYTKQVAEAAVEARAGYLDIQLSSQKLAILKAMEAVIRQAGCCFITEGGFHPGLPGLMVRYVAQYFDRLESAKVGSVIKEDWKKLDIEDSTVVELLELMNDFELLTFKDGRWVKVGLLGMADIVSMDFGGKFGRQSCYPMMLEEMRALPGIYPSLKETGFFVGSFNWFVDWLIMPIAFAAVKLWPQGMMKPMARWMHWGLNEFSKPPFGTILKVEAKGDKDGKAKKVAMTIAHPDGYMFTAIPVAACLLQVLDGSIEQPGLWLQAHIVEPVRFLQDMQRMGIRMQMDEGGSLEMEQK